MTTPTRLDRSVAAALGRRTRALNDTCHGGRAYCHRLAAATDDWIAALAERAREEHPRAPHFAVLAVGGYGRGELSPQSDIDLLVVHQSKSSAALEAPASAIWYPIWDAGLKLGHAVRSVDDQLALAKTDLDTATAMLTARFIAGDPKIADKVVDAGTANWTRRRKRWLNELHQRVVRRQQQAGEVAYILEPDLKDGHGGIRDVQSIWWAEVGGLKLLPEDDASLNECYDVLLRARVALHRATDRPGDTLRLDLQDAAASEAGAPSADAFMAELAAAARTIAWIADETWGRLGKTTGGAPDEVAPGVMLIDGEMELAVDADPATDPMVLLRIATAAARHRVRIGRRSLDRLTAEVTEWPMPWPAGAVDQLVALLLEGHAAIPVIESLDQRGLVTRLLPEWEDVRSKPQRNAYHRFTVDRHLWEAAANAAELADRVGRPDLLLLGALFHDIGKGRPGDHTEVGMEMVREMGPRLGVSAPDVDTLVAMVEHHLLLPDVAVRRDLADPVTIAWVAETIGTPERLELLHMLTIADSKATGPAAWGPWKADLVDDLAARVGHVLGGGDVTEATWTLFPDASTLAAMARGETEVVTDGDHCTVVYRDVPGAFSRLAGVLSLHGLDVMSAKAHSAESQVGGVAMGASRIRVDVSGDEVDWEPVAADLRRALHGELAIEARLAERAKVYRRRRVSQAELPGPPSVTFHDGASSNATVVEVHCTTGIGVLYRITKALAEVGLDIRHATVQTIGMEVVDTFYVRNWAGDAVLGPEHRDEIRRAVLHAVA